MSGGGLAARRSLDGVVPVLGLFGGDESGGGANVDATDKSRVFRVAYGHHTGIWTSSAGV